MKFVLSIAVPALLLAAPSFAQNAAPYSPAAQAAQTPGGKTDPGIAAPTQGIQGSTTGAAHMNGPSGDGSASLSSSSSASNALSSSTSMASNSSVGAALDSSPTYQGGRAAYRGKSRLSLDRSEAQITAELNQQFSSH